MERYLVFSTIEIGGKTLLARVAVRENTYKWKKQFACETLGYFDGRDVYIVCGSNGKTNTNKRADNRKLLTECDPSPFDYPDGYTYADLLRGIRNIDVSGGVNARIYFHGEPPAKPKKKGEESPAKPTKDKKITDIVELKQEKPRIIADPFEIREYLHRHDPTYGRSNVFLSAANK